MPLIEWRDEFLIGVPDVDHEHREMIALINALHASLGEGAEREAVLDVLGRIHDQIASHFALEEKIMRDTEYDGYPSHKSDHEALLDELRDIMDRVEDDGTFDEKRLSRELDVWFTEHFRTQDARFHRHVHASGQASRNNP